MPPDGLVVSLLRTFGVVILRYWNILLPVGTEKVHLLVFRRYNAYKHLLLRSSTRICREEGYRYICYSVLQLLGGRLVRLAVESHAANKRHVYR